MLRIPARNVAAARKDHARPAYAAAVRALRLRRWRVRLASGQLTLEMLTPEDRGALLRWIVAHPRTTLADDEDC